MVATLRGWCSEEDPGEWKPGEKAPLKMKLECSYYKLEHAGELVHEIVPNMVRIVDGVDQLAAARTALGV